MDWIVQEIINSIEDRKRILNKLIEDDEIPVVYKASKKEEMNFLKEMTEEIFQMVDEEIEHFNYVEEEARAKKLNAYI